MITDFSILKYLHNKGFYVRDKSDRRLIKSIDLSESYPAAHPTEVVAWLAREKNIIIDYEACKVLMCSHIKKDGEYILEDTYPKRFYSKLTDPFECMEEAIIWLCNADLIP